jgi:hypothetical protein
VGRKPSSMFRTQTSNLFKGRIGTSKIVQRNEYVRQAVQSRNKKLSMFSTSTNSQFCQLASRNQIANRMEYMCLID